MRDLKLRILAIWHILTYGLYYHVEIMHDEVHPVYDRLTCTVVQCNANADDVEKTVHYFTDQGARVRVAIIAGYLDV